MDAVSCFLLLLSYFYSYYDVKLLRPCPCLHQKWLGCSGVAEAEGRRPEEELQLYCTDFTKNLQKQSSKLSAGGSLIKFTTVPAAIAAHFTK